MNTETLYEPVKKYKFEVLKNLGGFVESMLNDYYKKYTKKSLTLTRAYVSLIIKNYLEDVKRNPETYS